MSEHQGYSRFINWLRETWWGLPKADELMPLIMARYTLEEALGLPISAELGKFKANLLMLRYDEAIYVEVDDPASLPGFDTPQERR